MANYQTQFGTFQFAMKDRYDQIKRVANLCEADRPLLAMMSKDTDFSGDGTHIPLIYARPQGISTSLGSAQTAKDNLKGSKFILTAGDYSGAVDIADKTIKASRNNYGAFFKARMAECDNLISQMADDLAHAAYGNGGLSLGEVASVSTNEITLTEPTDAYAFEVGMVIEGADTDGTTTGTVVTPTDGEVTAVDREAGVITVTNNGGAISAGDFLFRAGTFPDGETDKLMVGLSGYIWHDNAPPVLYGMNRSADPQRQAGSRVPSADLRGKSAEQRLRLLGTYMTGRYKGKGATHGFVNPEDWDQIVTSLSSRGYRTFKEEKTSFGFEGIKFVAGGKSIDLYSDPYCQKGTAFLLRLEDWKLHSMGELIAPIQEDGNVILRAANSNDYEFRAQSYPAISCKAPGYSGRVSLA